MGRRRERIVKGNGNCYLVDRGSHVEEEEKKEDLINRSSVGGCVWWSLLGFVFSCVPRATLFTFLFPYNYNVVLRLRLLVS